MFIPYSWSQYDVPKQFRATKSFNAVAEKWAYSFRIFLVTFRGELVQIQYSVTYSYNATKVNWPTTKTYVLPATKEVSSVEVVNNKTVIQVRPFKHIPSVKEGIPDTIVLNTWMDAIVPYQFNALKHLHRFISGDIAFALFKICKVVAARYATIRIRYCRGDGVDVFPLYFLTDWMIM